MTGNAPNLKSALWDAASALRGSAVNRTDWTGYIFSPLFFMRTSHLDVKHARIMAIKFVNKS
jgi:hypothetical protein